MSAVSSTEWLHIHRFIVRLSFAFAVTFAWVLIFHYWLIGLHDPAQALVHAALLYALSQTVVVLVTPYAASLLHLGMRRGMIYGILFASVGFSCLAGTFQTMTLNNVTIAGLIAFAICMGLYRALYWIPYVIEKRSLHAQRTPFWYELPLVLMPTLAGLTIVLSDYSATWLLYGTAALLVVSVFPLLGVKEKKELFPWHHTHAFGWLLDHAGRFRLRLSFLDGMQSVAIFFFWPVAVLILAGFSYLTLGIVLTLTALIVLLSRPHARRWLFRLPMSDTPMFDAAVAFSSWIVRLVVVNPLSFVVVDSYYRISSPSHHGADMYAQEHAADAGVYIDENSALKEMGLALGKVAMCIVVAAMAVTTTISTALVGAFLIAAIASVAGVFLVHRESTI